MYQKMFRYEGTFLLGIYTDAGDDKKSSPIKSPDTRSPALVQDE
jgi:hypothetical protein